MITGKRIICLLLGMFFGTAACAGVKTIALTIDDLPFVGSSGHTGKNKDAPDRLTVITDTLIAQKIPATGFVIAGSIGKKQWPLLEAFRNSGFQLGNHTYTHISLGSYSAAAYDKDVGHADKVLSPLLTSPKYFRYPYLAEGRGKKKQEVREFLNKLDYTIAPVTIDSKDYRFNANLIAIPRRERAKHLEQIKTRYLSYIWKQTLQAESRAKTIDGEYKSQILLIHANMLNSLFLADLIEMYKKNGYEFISLTDALRSPAPAITAEEFGEMVKCFLVKCEP